MINKDDVLKVKVKIDKLIINSPYEEPSAHWYYESSDKQFRLLKGRRPAGYIVSSETSNRHDDPGVFKDIELVNQIRPHIKMWRENSYPGVTGITRRLLEHWNEKKEKNDIRFFFCQLEAIETLIWLTETTDDKKNGIEIPLDGGEFIRWCCKMATGSGKTIVMAMLIAWQVLNKVIYPNDDRFSKYFFIVAPGLTVKSRLQVLKPSNADNYYQVFNIIPSGLVDKLRHAKIVVENWHKLNWETEEQVARKKSVDKRGMKSDLAYAKEVLKDLGNAKDIIVINDEAHHAWRVNPEYKVKKEFKDEETEATIWVGGLDRLHKVRNILKCFDFTATPFAPSGKKAGEEALFDWIVSDFGLNDAIESGLVKTPRVVIRDDSKLIKNHSRLYHIYKDPDVHDDLNRKADENETLPDLVVNAYYLLGKDWLTAKEEWEKSGYKVPPVMITVANRTETAARIENAFKRHDILIKELWDEEKLLHIDSKVLNDAESQAEPVKIVLQGDEDVTEKKLNKKQLAEMLRGKVDTIGRVGYSGEQIQKVISVGMLSEGWDAKTVTHIMGLRAFSSQLLCEQVIGRGLRRVSYDVEDNGLLSPEYVNIFGVPFSFLPHEDTGGTPPPPPRPVIKIEIVKEKQDFEITWPNIIRIDHVYKPVLSVDISKVRTLEIDPYDSITSAELSAIMEGKPSFKALTDIDLKELNDKIRLQTVIFETAKRIYNSEKNNLPGRADVVLIQIIKIVEQFIESERIAIKMNLYKNDPIRIKILMILNMNKIVTHILQTIRFENTQDITPVFDTEKPIGSTNYMPIWYTKRDVQWTEKSHVNYCVIDSGWEGTEAFMLDKNPNVKAWVKNDHLGFNILYNYQGIIRKYRPDFIIRLTNNENLVLEVKGEPSEESTTKELYLNEWIEAVNQHGGFGKWHHATSYHPNDIDDKIGRII
ncbi:MAG: DEAD/DEAH box helicase family protein [bacterium]